MEKRKASNEIIEAIKRFEGFCERAVKDGSGYTIGYGHCRHDISTNETITIEAAEVLLKEDLVYFENGINSRMNKWGKSFTQHEFDALLDFSFNCGLGALDTLTGNGKKTKTEISERLPLWNKANGKVLDGLVKRRQWEVDYFNTPDVVTQSSKKLKILVETNKNYYIREGAGTRYRAVDNTNYEINRYVEVLGVSGEWVLTNLGYIHKDGLRGIISES